MTLQFIYPDWPLNDKVTAFTTCRTGGSSLAPFNELNPAIHVGDDKQHVISNRNEINQFLGEEFAIKWLNQTHSTRVVDAQKIIADEVDADASYTCHTKVACAVLTADCLPLLFSNAEGTCVAAAHAGWRGLADGVIENTINAMSQVSMPEFVWMGPAISPKAFEVGPDVYQSFVTRKTAFESCFKANGEDKWNFDIYQAARIVFEEAKIKNIYGGTYCTYYDESKFFSYRRDNITGRMATIIARRE